MFQSIKKARTCSFALLICDTAAKTDCILLLWESPKVAASPRSHSLSWSEYNHTLYRGRFWDNIYTSHNGLPSSPDGLSNGPPNGPDGPLNDPDGPPNGPDGGAGDRRLRPGELTIQGIMSPPIFVSWDQYSSLFLALQKKSKILFWVL